MQKQTVLIIGLLVCIMFKGAATEELSTEREIVTIKDSNRIYVTRGYVEVDQPFSTVSQVINDFAAYEKWALEGLDGSDPAHADIIGLLKGIEYREPGRRLVVTYDINIPKPFGSYGNTVDLDIVNFDPRCGQDQVTYIVLAEEPTGVEYASLEYVLYELESGALIRFTAQLKFAWYVDMFFSVDGYRKGIEWRIGRFLSNLQARIEK